MIEASPEITAALARGLELIERNRQAEVSTTIIQRLEALRLVDGVDGLYRPTKVGIATLAEHLTDLGYLERLRPCQLWRA